MNRSLFTGGALDRLGHYLKVVQFASNSKSLEKHSRHAGYLHTMNDTIAKSSLCLISIHASRSIMLRVKSTNS